MTIEEGDSHFTVWDIIPCPRFPHGGSDILTACENVTMGLLNIDYGRQALRLHRTQWTTLGRGVWSMMPFGGGLRGLPMQYSQGLPH